MTHKSRGKQPSYRTLILIRHAHRDTTDRSLNNGLDAKGRAQAKRLLRHFVAYGAAKYGAAGVPAHEVRVVSSPKRRCVETVAAIAAVAGTGVEESALLVEQADNETEERMGERAARFVREWAAVPGSPRVTIACSHGDWLPEALLAATGGRMRLKKGAWAEIRLPAGARAPRLEWLLQEV